MAGGTSILLKEQRRHRLMNLLLILLFVLGGFAITNQRSLFNPATIDSLISATARAFAAVAAPSDFGGRRMDHVPMVLPLPPLNAHALPREVRRRLTDALSTIPDDSGDNQPITNNPPLGFAGLPQFASFNAPNPGSSFGGPAPTFGFGPDFITGPGSDQPVCTQTGTASTNDPSCTQPGGKQTCTQTNGQTTDPSNTQDCSGQQGNNPGGSGSTGGSGNGPGAVPEPSAWAMMILGFGAVGFALRARRQRRLALD